MRRHRWWHDETIMQWCLVWIETWWQVVSDLWAWRWRLSGSPCRAGHGSESEKGIFERQDCTSQHGKAGPLQHDAQCSKSHQIIEVIKTQADKPGFNNQPGFNIINIVLYLYLYVVNIMLYHCNILYDFLLLYHWNTKWNEDIISLYTI